MAGFFVCQVRVVAARCDSCYIPAKVKNNHNMNNPEIAIRQITVTNELGYTFQNEAARQAWEAWALQKVAEGENSPVVPHAEAMRRLEQTLADVRRKLV